MVWYGFIWMGWDDWTDEYFLEQSDNINMDVMLWPRSSAAAEAMWSGNNKATSGNGATGRMTDMRFRLVKRGIQAEPITPLFCAKNPLLCSFPLN